MSKSPERIWLASDCCAGWDGYPPAEHRNRSGWHWLSWQGGEPVAWQWEHDICPYGDGRAPGSWRYHDPQHYGASGVKTPEMLARAGWKYLSPCLPPVEITALQEELTKTKDKLAQLDDHYCGIYHPEFGSFWQPPTETEPAGTGWCMLQSERAEALREAREVLESIAECLPKMGDPDAVPEETCREVEITWGQRAAILKLLEKEKSNVTE